MITRTSLLVERILLAYWLVSGVVCGIYFLEVLQYKDEWQDKVRDFVWNTGLSDEFWHWIAFTISFIFGFYLLPKKIIRKILKSFGIIIGKKKDK